MKIPDCTKGYIESYGFEYQGLSGKICINGKFLPRWSRMCWFLWQTMTPTILSLMTLFDKTLKCLMRTTMAFCSTFGEPSWILITREGGFSGSYQKSGLSGIFKFVSLQLSTVHVNGTLTK